MKDNLKHLGRNLHNLAVQVAFVWALIAYWRTSNSGHKTDVTIIVLAILVSKVGITTAIRASKSSTTLTINNPPGWYSYFTPGKDTADQLRRER